MGTQTGGGEGIVVGWWKEEGEYCAVVRLKKEILDGLQVCFCMYFIVFYFVCILLYVFYCFVCILLLRKYNKQKK